MKIIQIQNNHNVNDDRPEFDRALIASLPASSTALYFLPYRRPFP